MVASSTGGRIRIGAVHRRRLARGLEEEALTLTLTLTLTQAWKKRLFPSSLVLSKALPGWLPLSEVSLEHWNPNREL